MTLTQYAKFFVLTLLLNQIVFAATLEQIDEEIRARDEAYNEYSIYLSDLENSFAKQMQNEFGIHVYGTMGRMHRRIKWLGLQFQADRRATIEEARALHLTVVNKYVEAINADERLRPFLKTYPFNHEQVEISIKYLGVHGPQADGSICFTHNVHIEDEVPYNKIFYSTRDPFNWRFVDVFEETYEDAIALNARAAAENLLTHQTSARENAIDLFLSQFTERMHKKHSLECWAIGGDLQGDIENVGVKFVALRRASQAQARELLLDIALNLLEDLNNNEALKPYFVEDEFLLERLKINLCFKKKGTYFSFSDGTMESVRLEDGRITYYREIPAEEAKHLTVFPIKVPVYATESYQEALAELKK